MLSQLNVLSARTRSRCRRRRSNVRTRSRTSRRDTRIARSRQRIATWLGCVTSATGRSVAICSPQTAFHRRGVRIPAKNERRRERRVSRSRGTTAAGRVQAPERASTRSMAKLTWDDRPRDPSAGAGRRRATGHRGSVQDLATAVQRRSSAVTSGIRTSKLTTGDEMRDRIIGALDTGCRRGEMLKIQNKHVDWRAPLDPNPEGALEDGGGARYSVRGRQPARGAVATASISRTGRLRVRRGNDRRVRGSSEVSVGDAAPAGQRHRADARRQRQASVEARRRSRRSTCTGTTCDTRRCHGWPTMAFPFTSCSCSPGTRASRRRSAT